MREPSVRRRNIRSVGTLGMGFSLRRMPWALLGAAVLLALVGVLFIASADSSSTARRQLVFLLIGIGAFFAAAAFDYRQLPPSRWRCMRSD